VGLHEACQLVLVDAHYSVCLHGTQLRENLLSDAPIKPHHCPQNSVAVNKGENLVHHILGVGQLLCFSGILVQNFFDDVCRAHERLAIKKIIILTKSHLVLNFLGT
jgi:hypothetical protein